MKKIVIIGKLGTIKTQNIKDISIESLFKKCKFRNTNNFSHRHTWKYKDNFVSIYTKDQGRGGSENKYDLPPPLDKKLYFGDIAIIKHSNRVPNNNELLNLTKEEWGLLYAKLFGGFEELGTEDSYSEEESIPDEFKTKNGYSKESGFIVDDNEEVSIEESDTSEEECVSTVEEDDKDDALEYDSPEEVEETKAFGTESDIEENTQVQESSSEEEDDELENAGSELSEEEYDY
jgi:hypothetical protein